MDPNYANFGLTGDPFPELARGSWVFVGPKAAGFIRQFSQALQKNDAVVLVSGPVGSGKTTLVTKALAATSTRRKTVTVGGAPLQPDEVVEHLLIIFGMVNVPAERAERLRAWQDIRDELRAANMRLFVVIEDALETGADVIAEFGALTENDADGGGGGNLVLMGDSRMAELVTTPGLVAVQERVALDVALPPMSEPEVRGYVRHAFRAAGGDFDRIFEADCVALLSKLSEGIPAAVNSIVASCLSRAADRGLDSVSAKLLAEVGAAAYDTGQERFNFWRPAVARRAAGRQEPDLEALARAVARARGQTCRAAQKTDEKSVEELPVAKPPTPSETSREKAISSGMESAGQFGLNSETVAATLTEAGGDLDKIARRLAEAKTLDDIDDATAETLFGEEMAIMAAAVRAKVSQAEASNDARVTDVKRRGSAT